MRILAHHDVDTFPSREPMSRVKRPAHSQRPRKTDAAATSTRKAGTR